MNPPESGNTVLVGVVAGEFIAFVLPLTLFYYYNGIEKTN
jgi:hypothetical protein